ncbi:hypothetical protein ACLOJK_004336 [Asimina triloba]
MVGSSLTGTKQDIENCNDPGSSSYEENEESYPVRADEQVYPSDGVKSLGALRNEKGYTTRYFIIKSLSHHNIQLSIEKGIWATQVMNEPILDEAFHNSNRVILIFSVNMSGFFQGYAQMMSSVGWRRENIWSDSDGGSNPWGRTFKVKWLQLSNLPFQKTLHLKNPLNDYKPVKISRDCQELSQDVGEALCSLIDGDIGMDEQPKRDASVPLQEDYASVSSSKMSWASSPVLYPQLFYQHSMLADAHDYQKMCGASPEGFAQLPAQSKAQNSSQTKHACGRGNPFDKPDKRDRISDEDILDMVMHFYLGALSAFHGSEYQLIRIQYGCIGSVSAITDTRYRGVSGLGLEK